MGLVRPAGSAQQDAEAAHAQLVQALLDSLTQAAMPTISRLAGSGSMSVFRTGVHHLNRASTRLRRPFAPCISWRAGFEWRG